MGNLEAFAISFAKLVQIMENVKIEKEIDIDVWVQGTSAIAKPRAKPSRSVTTRIPRRWL